MKSLFFTKNSPIFHVFSVSVLNNEFDFNLSESRRELDQLKQQSISINLTRSICLMKAINNKTESPSKAVKKSLVKIRTNLKAGPAAPRKKIYSK